jgi:hypothetical protein
MTHSATRRDRREGGTGAPVWERCTNWGQLRSGRLTATATSTVLAILMLPKVHSLVRQWSGEGKQLRRKLRSTDRSAGMTSHNADLPKHFQSVHVADVRNQDPLQLTQPHLAFEGTSRGFSAVKGSE